MTADCKTCPVHKAMLDLHATAKMVAGRPYPRRARIAPASTLARDELRRAVEAFEAASAEILGLAFGDPDCEVRQ